MGAARDLVSAAKRIVTPGQPLTKARSPRVLIHDFGDRYEHVNGRPVRRLPSEAEGLADRLRASGVPTVRVVTFFDDYNLTEWDCLVTTREPLQFEEGFEDPETRYEEPKPVYSWKQEYPPHLCVVHLVSRGPLRPLDAYPPTSDRSARLPMVLVARRPDVPGDALRQADGLPDSLAALVMRDLVPVAKARTKHPSFMWHPQEGADDLAQSMLQLTPFLYGPDDVVLACSYPRNKISSIWLIPDDVPDAHPWVIEALREWHDLYPDRFPALPGWRDNSDWRSAQEAAIAKTIDEHFEAFKAKYENYLAEKQVLEERAEIAKRAADSYQRALLSEDGPALERAVQRAIEDLGFRVDNMDDIHGEGNRREDLRVYDDADPSWVAIVEIKGGKGGAKENELHAVGKWAMRFALDEHRAPSAQWFVVNHLRLTDPNERPAPFGNKPAVAQTFSEQDGSVIDTRALFDLLRLVESESHLKPAARALIKDKPPALTRVEAADIDRYVPVAGSDHS